MTVFSSGGGHTHNSTDWNCYLLGGKQVAAAIDDDDLAFHVSDLSELMAFTIEELGNSVNAEIDQVLPF